MFETPSALRFQEGNRKKSGGFQGLNEPLLTSSSSRSSLAGAPAWWIAWAMLPVAVAQLLLGAGEKVLFARMAGATPNGALVVHTVLTLLNVLLYALLRLARAQSSAGQVPAQLRRLRPARLAAMGVLDALHSLLLIDSAASLRGITQAVLAQASLPFTVGFACIVANRGARRRCPPLTLVLSGLVAAGAIGVALLPLPVESTPPPLHGGGSGPNPIVSDALPGSPDAAGPALAARAAFAVGRKAGPFPVGILHPSSIREQTEPRPGVARRLADSGSGGGPGPVGAPPMPGGPRQLSASEIAPGSRAWRFANLSLTAVQRAPDSCGCVGSGGKQTGGGCAGGLAVACGRLRGARLEGISAGEVQVVAGLRFVLVARADGGGGEGRGGASLRFEVVEQAWAHTAQLLDARYSQPVCHQCSDSVAHLSAFSPNLSWLGPTRSPSRWSRGAPDEWMDGWH